MISIHLMLCFETMVLQNNGAVFAEVPGPMAAQPVLGVKSPTADREAHKLGAMEWCLRSSKGSGASDTELRGCCTSTWVSLLLRKGGLLKRPSRPLMKLGGDVDCQDARQCCLPPRSQV